jgi:DNA-binding LacI/PurR family transcriptional regulator
LTVTSQGKNGHASAEGYGYDPRVVSTRAAATGSNRRPVMHDVARLAGVSHQTVSRVLNNHPSVRTTTRQRVLDAMRELDYRPNNLARSLVTSRTHRIGVLSFDLRYYGPSSTLVAIEQAAHDRGYGLALASLTEPDAHEAANAVAMLDAQRVDGLIVIAPHRGAVDAIGSLPRALPVVALEAEFRKDVSVVSIDQRAGARLATEHLLDLGHRTVSHVAGPADWNEARLRTEGWRRTLADRGVAAPEPLRGDWTSRSGYEAGLRLAAARDVTAVFAANDQMALGVLRAFHEQGIAVPDDRSVVGFDDLPESEFLIPGLTTVRQDFDAVGRNGLERLVTLIEGGTVRRRVVYVEPELIVRASSARPKRRAAPRARSGDGHGRRGKPSARR